MFKIVILLFFISVSYSLTIKTDTIPQGEFQFELYFSEWGGRMDNAPCKIVIKKNIIKIFQSTETNLSGKNLILEGKIVKHSSGRWVIIHEKTNNDIDEIGGCTGGPIPIDFDMKIIEWC
jgi:hypothetical protein